MLKKIVFAATFFTVFTILIQACVYHKGDQQYPSANNSCDTTNVSYRVDIKAILDENCSPCHYEGNDVSFINLYDYETISGLALDGQFTYGTLLSAVMHEGGAPEMPKGPGSPKLQDCDINKIAAWVHHGAKDN